MTGFLERATLKSMRMRDKAEELLTKLVDAPATPWFCLGMGIEGLGLGAEAMLRMPILPLVDGLVGLALAALIFYHQSKRAEEE